MLLLLNEYELVAYESGGLSPVLDKEHAESSSFLWSRVQFNLIVDMPPVIEMMNVVQKWILKNYELTTSIKNIQNYFQIKFK